MEPSLSSDTIFEIGQSFWKAKALLSAVELDLFTILAAEGWLEIDTICERVGMHPRGARDFLDALVALGLLRRDAGQRYANTNETDLFLDRHKPSYCGGFLEMCNQRLYPAWSGLTTALQTGRSVHDEDTACNDFYTRLYANRESRETFLGGMTGGSMPVARAIATQFPWHEHHTVVDVGCAEGCLLAAIALAHPHLQGRGFDLAAVEPSFDRFMAATPVNDRVTFHAGDFRVDAFPAADVIVFGRVLHNWNLGTKRQLLAKAWASLPPGGRVLVYERLIDDERRTNATALLASVNMLVVTPEGFDFTGAECAQWMHDAGFRDTRVEPLVASHGMVIGTK